MRQQRARATHRKPRAARDNADPAIAMVNIGPKAITHRTAVAEAVVSMNSRAYDALRSGQLPKGDAIRAAQLAGVLAAKKTPQLIPLCHPLLLSHIEVSCRVEDNSVILTAAVQCEGRTGVEMEAMTAAAVAGLTIYDMCKSLDRGVRIERIRLLSKAGGKSGPYVSD